MVTRLESCFSMIPTAPTKSGRHFGHWNHSFWKSTTLTRSTMFARNHNTSNRLLACRDVMSFPQVQNMTDNQFGSILAGKKAEEVNTPASSKKSASFSASKGRSMPGWNHHCYPLSLSCKTSLLLLELYFPKQLWSWLGFSILPRNRLRSIIISGFWLGFRFLSPYSFGILFHHHFLVPARVPGLVSLLFWHPVPSSFPRSG